MSICDFVTIKAGSSPLLIFVVTAGAGTESDAACDGLGADGECSLTALLNMR